VLPEHRVTVLPSELTPSAVLPPVAQDMSGMVIGSSNGSTTAGDTTTWKIATGVFAALWLLTLVYFYRRGPVIVTAKSTNGSASLDQKELLKQVQQSCQSGDASSARKYLAQWIRSHAPENMRGSMRDFGVVCNDTDLQTAIAELDIWGFTGDSGGSWNGTALWSAFKKWQSTASGPRNSDIGEEPNLYAG